MIIKLSENIQLLRKQKGMTQEQLADVMGVTVGAVSKWENGLSNPDLTLIPELADFFEVSVDVLLGYGWENRSMGAIAKEIRQLDKEKRYEEALAVSLKALQKYPNSFDIVYASAVMQRGRGLQQHKEEAFRTSIELFERAEKLIQQNKDERINEIDLKSAIARNYGYLSQYDEAIERLKKINPGGINDIEIGTFYVQMGEYDKAEDYFSQAFENNIVEMINLVIHMSNCYLEKKEYKKVIELSNWMKQAIAPLVEGEKEGYLTKSLSYFGIDLVMAYLYCSKIEEAKEALREAYRAAFQFAQKPDYRTHIRFIKETDHVLSDDIGNGEEYFETIKQQCEEEPELYQKFCSIYDEVKKEEALWIQNNLERN